MGAPRVDPEGTEVISFSAPATLGRRVRAYKEQNKGEFSSMVCSLLEAQLGTKDRELLNAKLRATDLQIIAIERELLLVREAKAQIEAQLRTLDLQKDRHVDARLQLLEKYIRGGVNRPWLDSRVDVLAECNFANPEEAVRWLEQQQAVMVR